MISMRSEINWCLAPQKVKVTSLYLSLKVANPERLYGVKIMKIRAIENLTLGHLWRESDTRFSTSGFFQESVSPGHQILSFLNPMLILSEKNF